MLFFFVSQFLLGFVLASSADDNEVIFAQVIIIYIAEARDFLNNNLLAKALYVLPSL